MAQKNELEIKLPSVDRLFSTQAERDDAKLERVVKLSPDIISDFPDHPFQVRKDKKLMDMIESISQYGVLVPALVRPLGDGNYQMVAGHRRKMVCKLLGIEIPCIVRNLSDDEATVIMVDSNIQREDILPSEKAFAYKMKMEVMNRQGYRTDLTSTPLVQKLSMEILGEQHGESRETVRRFIRLTYLIQDILEMVDNDGMALRPAVEISYLTKAEQEILYEVMKHEACTPSLSQAKSLRKISQERGLTENDIYGLLSQEKPNQKEKIVLVGERFEKYFTKGMTTKQKEETILKALDFWYKHLDRKKDRDR